MAKLKIRIFLSSPGDVATERVRAEKVIHKLQVEFGRRVELEPFVWEHEPMRATASFNDPDNIPLTSEFDVVICVLWTRLGTMLSTRFLQEDGTPYPSGTAFELAKAYESYQKRQSPDVLVYRRNQEFSIPVDNVEERKRRLDQSDALQIFIKKWFFDESGAFRFAFNSYTSVAQFEANLEDHLRKLIEKRVQKHLQSQPSSSPDDDVKYASYHEGNPFRGLDPYRFEDAEIFFGRAQAIEDVMSGLRRQAVTGRPVVILHGMSGSGKSSLIRAGVMPLLVQPGVIEGIAAWRRAEFRPGAAAEQPFLGLAKALIQDDALPELGRVGIEVETLAQAMESEPGRVPAMLGQALQQVSSDLQTTENLPSAPVCRLVLLVDQLEELFSDEVHFNAFVRLKWEMALAAMIQSGLVWVIMTLRSDQIGRLPELKTLSSLTADGGQLLLSSPSEIDISLMIRLPAKAAGVEFELNASGDRLEDRLLREARNVPDGLPLLGFVLQTLYEEMGEDSNLLTHAALDELEGIEGAVASQAGKAFAAYRDSLDKDSDKRADTALAILTRALTTLSTTDAKAPPLRRIAHLEPLVKNEDVRKLVQHLIDARLLTTGATEQKTPTVHVSHEALFRKWPRLKKAIEADRKFLQYRQRAEAAASEWISNERKDEYLWDRGQLLEDALFLLSHGSALDGTAKEFAERSEQCAETRRIEAEKQHIEAEKQLIERKKKEKTRKIQLSVLITLLVAAIPTGVFAYRHFRPPERIDLTPEQKAEIERVKREKEIASLEEQLGNVAKGLDASLWKTASDEHEDEESFDDEDGDTGGFPEFEAAELSRRLNELVPDHPRAYAVSVRADIARAARGGDDDPDKLYQDIEKRLSEWPSKGMDRDELLDLKAQMAWDRGDKSQAALLWSDYSKTPALSDPVRRRVFDRVSEILIEQKKWRDARLLLDRWIGWSDNAVARARRAKIALVELRLEEAVKDLERAEELQPDLDELGTIKPEIERAAQYHDEIQQATVAINAGGASPQPWIDRARVLLLAGQNDAAVSDIEQGAKKFNAKSTFLPLFLGIAKVRAGSSLPEDSEIIRYTRWNGEDQDFSAFLEEEWDGMMRLFAIDQKLANKQEDPQTQFERASALWRMGQPKLALADAESLYKKASAVPQVQTLYVACLEGAGRDAEAISVADKGLAAFPNNPDLYRFRAEAQFDLGSYEAALHSIEQALAPLPNQWVYWDLKARILEKLEREDEARVANDRSIELKKQAQR